MARNKNKEEVVDNQEEVYKVAKGKSLTSKIGILADGDIVKAEYFFDGEKAFKKLVEQKYIVSQ